MKELEVGDRVMVSEKMEDSVIYAFSHRDTEVVFSKFITLYAGAVNGSLSVSEGHSVVSKIAMLCLATKVLSPTLLVDTHNE